MSETETHEHLAAFSKMLGRDAEASRLSMRDLQVISMLVAHDTPIPVGTVAAMLHIGAPAMSRLAMKLEERGLLVRDRTGADQRITMLRPTQAGREADARVRASYAKTHPHRRGRKP